MSTRFDDALALFRDQPFKVEIIEAVAARRAKRTSPRRVAIRWSRPTRTRPRSWISAADPTFPRPRDSGTFELTRVAGAYWRGDEKNPQLQRIYGTAWESKEALAAHLHQLEEAEARDHRKLGAELDLFSFPERDRSGTRALSSQGRNHSTRDGGVLAPASRGLGIRVRLLAPHHQGRTLRDLGPPHLVRRGHVPADGTRRGPALLPQADELSVSHDDLQCAPTQLSRVAAAHVRVRLGLSLREVRRRPRTRPAFAA